MDQCARRAGERRPCLGLGQPGGRGRGSEGQVTSEGASAAAYALDGATWTPAARSFCTCRDQPCGSCSVPVTEAIAVLCERSSALASTPAGSACAPKPITTSNSSTETAGAASAAPVGSVPRPGPALRCGPPPRQRPAPATNPS